MQRNELRRFRLPDEPGVYFFKRRRKILYIGKAGSLRDRVRSYFSKDLASGRGPAVARMVQDADALNWQTTESVLEALILEANLIKKHQPPANVESKDNKSFNYVILTKDAYPQVLLVRGRELFSVNGMRPRPSAVFGPFPHALQLQEAMKIVRKIFPYHDARCVPCGEGKNNACKPCFNRQLGLCPGVCTGEITRDEYGRTIKNIRELFSGNFKGLKRRLAARMKAAAEGERFEEAAVLRRQIRALEHVKDVSLLKDEHRIAPGGGVRIEAFDVAHTSGAETVAVMAVVHGGEPIKAAYRKFTIRTATNDDVAALTETLERRLNHPEWPLPRVCVVDGGKAQMNAARKVCKKAGIEIPLVGVVKNEFHRPERLIGDKRAIEAYEKDILLANSEAHRFAIGWHRKRRRKMMI
ncbi:MAG: hypothetical protein RLZZ416_148 [Candidatus Parcubacteria bacterium]|jgi:excinuclease ABC subunit C